MKKKNKHRRIVPSVGRSSSVARETPRCVTARRETRVDNYFVVARATTAETSLIYRRINQVDDPRLIMHDHLARSHDTAVYYLATGRVRSFADGFKVDA